MKQQPTVSDLRKLEAYLNEKEIKPIEHDGEVGAIIELCPEGHPLRAAAKRLWSD